MPTFYKRQTRSSRGQWSEDQLNRAARTVQEGQNILQAAKTYSIPWSTLKRRLVKGSFKKTSMGPSSHLGEAAEKKLVKHILKLQRFGFSPTRNEVRSMAFKLAEQLGVRHTFNRDKEMAGFDWLRLFLSRNPELSVRKSEGISLARVRNLNKEAVSQYFDLLQDILVNNDLVNKPANIFNVDETGLQLNNKPGYVIAGKGSRNVSSITSGEKGETISVISCCNAEGNFLPPACIFKGKNEKAEYKDGMQTGSTVYMSQKSPYVNTDIFLLWLKNHFVPRKPEGNVLLILDGHSSHCSSVETLEYAESKNITLLCLPSHTTHYLQPLDKSFFKALKSFYYNACNTYMKLNPSRRINRLSFGKLLSEAWEKATTRDNATSGFRATGIYPFNPRAIPEYAYLATQDPSAEANTHQTREENQERLTRDVTPQPTTSKSSASVGRKRSSEDEEMPLQPSTSTSVASVARKNSTDQEGLGDQLITPGKMLDQISPVPVVEKVEKVRKNSRQLAAVLNSPDSIASLKSKQNKKKMKNSGETKKNTKTKKTKALKKVNSVKNYKDSDSESSIEIELNDEEEIEEEEYCCVGCGESYLLTKKQVDWIQCTICSLWLHEDCTKFCNMCDLCGKNEDKKKRPTK